MATRVGSVTLVEGLAGVVAMEVGAGAEVKVVRTARREVMAERAA